MPQTIAGSDIRSGGDMVSAEAPIPAPTPPGRQLSEMSRRLQEGWTLLNYSCPIPACHTPLLKDARKYGHGEVYCVKCEMYCITPDKAKSLKVRSRNIAASTFTGPYVSPTQQQQGSSSHNEADDTNDDAHLIPAKSLTPPVIAAKEAAHAAADERMGEKLLLGWTMLADMCPTPDCCFPLLLDRDGDTICVACGGDGLQVQPAPRHEEQSHATANAPTRAPASSVASPSAALNDGGAILSQEEFASVRKRRDNLSAALGRFMLQGWSLLDKTCPREQCEPGTPLLKDRRTGTLCCAGCDVYDRGSGELGSGFESRGASSPAALPVKRGSSGENRNIPATTACSAADVQPMQVDGEYEMAERARLRKQAVREQQSDPLSASTGLAKRLLQGWTMLSAVCPTSGCNSPLMRDRSGAVSCVNCSGSPDAKHEASETAGQALGDIMQQEDEEDADGDDELLDDVDAERMYAEYRMEGLPACRQAPGTLVTAAGVGEWERENIAADEQSRIKAQALDTLFRAIDASQQRLRSCTEEGGCKVGVEESARQADLIRKLALAARALGDLST